MNNNISNILVPSEAGQEPAMLNFQRDLHSLFGLPVDNLSLPAMKQLIRERAPKKNNLVLSTININWVARSFIDPAFRAAILNSDLVTFDGKPLVWLGKTLGLPIQETVPGSTLIQELRDEKQDQPLTIFLFGGEGTTAELAMKQLNLHECGLEAVGAINPGFGSVEEMSSDRIINTINAASPDILLVALGAAKGVAWIEKNRHKLSAGIISHLGATVNFLAGTVHRAPPFMQKYGLEWAWRILQEPKLFSRYGLDALAIAKVLLGRIPQFLSYQPKRRHKKRPIGDDIGRWQETEDTIILTFGPHPRISQNSPLRDLFQRAALNDKELILDFKETEYVESAFLGLVALLQQDQHRKGKKLTFINTNKRLRSILNLFCIEHT